MSVLLGLIGLFVGAFLGSTLFQYETSLLSAAVGAVLGVLFGRLKALRDEIHALRRQVHSLIAREDAQPLPSPERPQRGRAPPPIPAAASAAVATPVAATAAAPQAATAATPPAPLPDIPDWEILDMPEPPSPPPRAGRAVFEIGAAPAPPPSASRAATTAPTASAQAASTQAASAQAARAQPQRRPPPIPAARPPRDDSPDFLERATGAIKRWFTEGNVPVKIGVLVLFLGVGALMKYAAEQGWVHVPIQLRMAGIAAVALAGLIFGWIKRESNRAFALSLQGGAIGMLLLVVFGSFKLFGLIPAGMAFALLVAIVAAGGVMAVAQDALALALLAIVGGFLAPVLTASDSGNHVALFTYYAVLNAAIFAIAWVKPWRALNLLGFVFTFGIGTAWGFLKYRPELFATTEPFLVLFYAFYLLIPVLYALRQPEDRRGFVDGSLVFGTPLFAFPLQAALLNGDGEQLALSALVLALAHTGVAWFALRRLRMSLLGQSHALLAVGFATLAVPLALSARATACAWALEGAALVWLGLRQQRQLPRVLGYVLQLAAGVSLLVGLADRSGPVPLQAIFNGDFLALLLVSAAGFTSAWLLRRDSAAHVMERLLFLWAMAWWLLLGINEVERFAAPDSASSWLLGFAALTAALSGELARRLSWSTLRWPAFVAILAAPVFILATAVQNPAGPLSGLGLAAWLGWFAASLRAQRNLAVAGTPGLAALSLTHIFTLCILLAVQLEHQARVQWQLGQIWQSLLTLAPFAAAFAVGLLRWRALRFPLGAAVDGVRPVLLGLLAGLLGIAWVIGLSLQGDPAPLAYLPLLNPLELAQIGFVLLMLYWFRQANADGSAAFDAQFRAQLLALAGFALLTSITLRSAHFLGGVPWSPALFSTALAQAGLSVAWCLAGLAAMVIGARRVSRPIWMGGAVLVGLVIVKLILVDRTHLKDLYAILGVLAVGGLLMLVGWFAPNPPKPSDEAAL
jgi:uncharacterized membrane protein